MSILDNYVSSPEKYYLLGLLWGDGYITHYKHTTSRYVYLGLIKEDMDDIINLFDNNWIIKNRKRAENRKIISEAFLFDKNFGRFLVENDFSEKSTVSPTKILSLIPEHFSNYFWRGYSDADGCFYQNKECFQYSISGSYEQDWSDTEKTLNNIGIKYSINRRIQGNNKHSVLRISNRKDVIKFGDFIYSGDIFGFTRKYKKYLNITNHISPTEKRRNEEIKIIKNISSFNDLTLKELSILTGITNSRLMNLKKTINGDQRLDALSFS